MRYIYEPNTSDYYQKYVYVHGLNATPYQYFRCSECKADTKNGGVGWDKDPKFVHKAGCSLGGRGIDDKTMEYYFGHLVALATAKWPDKQVIGRLPFEILERGFPELLKEVQQEIRDSRVDISKEA